MLDFDKVNAWRQQLEDRLTAPELVELLGLSVNDVFEAFLEECLELNPEDIE